MSLEITLWRSTSSDREWYPLFYVNACNKQPDLLGSQRVSFSRQLEPAFEFDSQNTIILSGLCLSQGDVILHCLQYILNDKHALGYQKHQIIHYKPHMALQHNDRVVVSSCQSHHLLSNLLNISWVLMHFSVYSAQCSIWHKQLLAVRLSRWLTRWPLLVDMAPKIFQMRS